MPLRKIMNCFFSLSQSLILCLTVLFPLRCSVLCPQVVRQWSVSDWWIVGITPTPFLHSRPWSYNVSEIAQSVCVCMCGGGLGEYYSILWNRILMALWPSAPQSVSHIIRCSQTTVGQRIYNLCCFWFEGKSFRQWLLRKYIWSAGP